MHHIIAALLLNCITESKFYPPPSPTTKVIHALTLHPKVTHILLLHPKVTLVLLLHPKVTHVLFLHPRVTNIHLLYPIITHTLLLHHTNAGIYLYPRLITFYRLFIWCLCRHAPMAKCMFYINLVVWSAHIWITLNSGSNKAVIYNILTLWEGVLGVNDICGRTFILHVLYVRPLQLFATHWFTALQLRNTMCT